MVEMGEVMRKIGEIIKDPGVHVILDRSSSAKLFLVSVVSVNCLLRTRQNNGQNFNGPWILILFISCFPIYTIYDIKTVTVCMLVRYWLLIFVFMNGDYNAHNAS